MLAIISVLAATQLRIVSLVGSCIALLVSSYPGGVFGADEVGPLLAARRPAIAMQLGLTADELDSIASQVDSLHNHMRDALRRYPQGGQDTEGERVREGLIAEIVAHEMKAADMIAAVLGPERTQRLANLPASELSAMSGRVFLERYTRCAPIELRLLLSGTSETQGKLLETPDNIQKSLSDLVDSKKTDFEQATSELLLDLKLYSPVRDAAMAGEFILLETYAFNR